MRSARLYAMHANASELSRLRLVNSQKLTSPIAQVFKLAKVRTQSQSQ